MKPLAMRLLAGALLSSSFLLSGFAAVAQDVTMVLPAREVGAPTYDPMRGTKLNTATTLIYDRMVLQDADQSYHGQLATEWSVTEDGMEWVFWGSGARVAWHSPSLYKGPKMERFARKIKTF